MSRRVRSITSRLDAPSDGSVASASLPKRVAPLLGVTFAAFWSVGVVLPLIPVTVVDRLGGSKGAVGVTVAALAFGSLTGRLIGGALTDARGSRATVAIGLGAIAVAGVALLAPPTVASIVLARFVQGAGESMIYTAVATVLVDIVPAHRRSRFLGLLGSAVWGSLTLGPALGESLATMRSAGVIVLASAGLGAVAAVFVPRRTSPATGRFALQFPRAALLPGIVISLYNLGYVAITGFVILHLRANGITPSRALTAYAVAVLLGRLAFGGLPDRLGPGPSLTVGISTMAVALAVVTWAPNRPTVLLALLCFGLGYSMPFPALASLTVDRVREHERAAALGSLTALYDIVSLVAGLGFGHLADSRSTTAVFGFAVAGIVCALCLSRVVVRQS